MSLFDGVGNILNDLGKKYGNVVRPIVQKTPGAKWVGSKTGNLWNAGIKMSKPVQAIGIAGLAVYSAVAGINAGSQYNKQKASGLAQDIGPIAATQYEGTGGARSNLNASGDLVFGLHNMRKGTARDSGSNSFNPPNLGGW